MDKDSAGEMGLDLGLLLKTSGLPAGTDDGTEERDSCEEGFYLEGDNPRQRKKSEIVLDL